MQYNLTAIFDKLIDNRFDPTQSTLPARVSAHAPQFSWSPSPYFLSDPIENGKFIYQHNLHA